MTGQLQSAAAPSRVEDAARWQSDQTWETCTWLDDLGLARVTESGLCRGIREALDAGQGGWVVTVNADIARRWRRDETFRVLCEEVTVMVADGMPLVWASQLRGEPLPERVAGSSLVRTLSGELAEAGRSLFLLGGTAGAAEKAGGVLMGEYPQLRIAGTHCPAFGFENDAEAMGRIESSLLAARPDVVYVALGSPKQERLIARLRPMLPGTWFMGVGISLSFLAGDVQRAPRWMQKTGLEWLHRMVQEPRRLYRRYLMENLPFVVGLLARSGWMRVRGERGETGRLR